MKRQIRIDSRFPLSNEGMQKFFGIFLNQFPEKDRSVEGILKCTDEASRCQDWQSFGIFCDTLWHEICTKCQSPVVMELKKESGPDNLGSLILNLLRVNDEKTVVAMGLLIDYADALVVAHNQMIESVPAEEPILVNLTEELMAVCHLIHDTTRASRIFEECFLCHIRKFGYNSTHSIKMCSAFKTSLTNLPPTHIWQRGISLARITYYAENFNVPMLGQYGIAPQTATDIMHSLGSAMIRNLRFQQVRNLIIKHS